MANFKIKNIAIKGISACVPAHVEENKSLEVFNDGEAERVIAQTGIERKHKVKGFGTTASDLCQRAFEKLLIDLGWEKDSIDVLAFVTLSPDFLEPPTGNVMHGRLGLKEDCLVLDLFQGCPGWVNGLVTISSLMSSTGLKRGILLNGDTATLMRSEFDKESLPLFGDAGTATALEYDESVADLEFNVGSRGKDFDAIIRPVGGFRSPITQEALQFKNIAEHIRRRDIDAVMDGMGVFAFGISAAPKSVKTLCDSFSIDAESLDFFLMHQANKYLNEKIRKFLKIPSEKVPYSLKDYGNTSGASIPLTIVTQCNKAFSNRKLNCIACAFGVGLAWGSVHFQTDRIICPDVIYYE